MKTWVGVCLFVGLAVAAVAASEHRGAIVFQGLPVPGATVVATRDGRSLAVSTDEQGRYSFPDLADGTWQVEIEMFGFAKVKREIAVGPAAPLLQWELTMLPLDNITALTKPATPLPVSAAQEKKAAASPATPGPEQKRSDQAPEASPQKDSDVPGQFANEDFLINGSVNNAADSPFAQSAAFGNARQRYSLYNGGLGLVFGNSALDARPFPLTGADAPKPIYSRMTGSLNFGGPLRLGRLFKQSPFFYTSYERSRRSDAGTQASRMPTEAERGGYFPQPVVDPLTGTAFPDNTIPDNRISPQARALLNYYPLPTSLSSSGYNYQTPVVTSSHQDSFQFYLGKAVKQDQVNAHFALQSSRSALPNLFRFTDATRALGMNTGLSWLHYINRRWQFSAGYSVSRQRTRATPYFAGRENVSSLAGIAGNSQEPSNWGPPELNFSSGMGGLSDGRSSLDRNQTSRVWYSMSWNRRTHHIVFGTEFYRNQFNSQGEQNPRGSFTFTGRATGNDFADFLLGIPDTASLTLGNANRYFRQTAYAGYLQDEWKARPTLSVTAGLRWDYAAPVTELFDHLANLDITRDFAAAAPVVASSRVGSLTGAKYARSLLDPNRHAIQPRIGLAWRPTAGSSLVVRSGYGLYYDSSVYLAIAMQMAQQPPLATTLSMQNNGINPLNMGNAFLAAATSGATTFAVDPQFRTGYAQNWYLSVQQDLPAALQMTASYQGIKGTHGVQEFLPNTSPIGASRCESCPGGFVYLTSGANSSRHAGVFQLRRRLRSGLMATAQYTFSKSIDNASALGVQNVAGGLQVAQDWRNLKAERSLSSFDQRHVVNVQMQYTTGMGLAGGMQLRGWAGGLFKQWTLASTLAIGTGRPQTPVYMAALPGTGIIGTIRPDYTGASIEAASGGLHLNPAAFSAPKPGAWGTAGRNSITGPGQFSLNASLGRSFRLRDKYNLDFRADATNLLNHVTYTAWDTSITSSQFGLPTAANTMRAIQTTLRVRF